jgi:hypothetical protein
LDINDLEKFNDPLYGNLIRRWWDIKDAGFFGKKLGTVMMDISVQRVPENQLKFIHDKPYNMCDRLDLLLMLEESSHQRYDELIKQTKNSGDEFSYRIPDFAHLLGDELLTGYRDYIYNQQKWTGYSIFAPLYQLIVGLILPVNNQVYLEVMFTYSPNQNVFPQEFRDVAYEKMQLIEDSLNVDYAKNNVMNNIVGKLWLKKKNLDVMAQHRDILLIPLFGSNIYQELADQKQLIADANKTFNQMDDDDQ